LQERCCEFMKEMVYWLALQQKYWLIPAEKIAQGIEELGSIERLWKTNESYLLKLGLSNSAVKRFVEYRNNVNIDIFEKQLDELYQKKMRLVRYTDKEYPPILKSIGLHAPRILFHRGMLLDFSSCIAIGGNRNCSEHGRRVAYDISRKLADNGYTVVSGLAVGIDTEAHKGALEAGGKTIAVLAWMDPIYPPENLSLSRKIEEHGAILSECYRKPNANLKWRFVERNKIVSGIAECVVIIETSEKGGTAQLARRALSQRKRVFVLEPKEDNEQALKGYKFFLGKGATSIKSCEELLGIFRNETQSKLKKRKSESHQSSLIAFGKSSTPR